MGVGLTSDRVEVKSARSYSARQPTCKCAPGRIPPWLSRSGVAHLPSSQAEVRTDPEHVPSRESRACADELHQTSEGKKQASRNVEQIPARQRCEVPKLQSVVRKDIAEKSLPISVSRSDQPPTTTGSDASIASRPTAASMD